ncbi:MAG: O-antigen ligase family protein [Thermoleophilia bacterium]|nr:O-antigen ligase family protein [Thermoleophilia bacterium]
MLEALLARGVVGEGLSRPLLLFAGVVAAAFVLRFPLATAFVFFGLTDFIFYPTFFAVELGPLSVRPHELALAGLFALALIRPEKQTWGGAAGAALAAFLAMLALSGGLAVLDGQAALTDVFNWGRPFALLTFFYVVVRLFPRPEQRRALLTAGAVLAALAGGVALLIALGSGIGDSLKGGGESIVKEEEGAAGLLRVRLAGLSMAYALFWYVAVRISAARVGRRAGWALVMLGMAVAILISFNRNMWLGIIAGLVMMMVAGGPFVRNRLAIALAISVAGIVLLASFGSATDSRLLDPVVQRASTLLNPSRVEASSSLTDRDLENSVAWPAAQRNALLGIGPGVDFGVYNREFVGPHSIQVEPQLFLHNQYLYLLLICGVPGLLAFLFFLGIPIVRAFKRIPTDPAVTACAVGIVTIMISSIVAIYFSVEDMTAVLGLLTGVIVADAENRAADGLESGLAP